MILLYHRIIICADYLINYILDGTGYKGRITYVMDNGEEKVVRENGVLYLGDLFQDNSQ